MASQLTHELNTLRAERNQMLEGLEALGWPCRLVELPAYAMKSDREIDRLRAVLAKIREWDCLNPPRADLLGDLPWLRKLVDEALSDEPSPVETAGNSVRIPTSEDEAALMVLLGTQWLEQNAPHRLRSSEKAREEPTK